MLLGTWGHRGNSDSLFRVNTSHLQVELDMQTNYKYTVALQASWTFLNITKE